MFGSCATKLYLPFSDLDLVVVTGDHGKANEKNLVKKLAKELFANKSLYENIEAILNAKVPLVKCRDKITRLNLDVSFNRENGISAVG